ncbi:nuclear transport factor 2 family protein [Pseudoclavibacter helvolus]|uniref:nuclear transport factor 2 family protein n=1 Tax=Pseudoclavibacter helvolus TaxID=255205 RepID=UPI003734CA30
MSLHSVPSAAAAIELYFEALHECDVTKLDRVFHETSSLYDVTDGVFTAMPFAEWREIVANRPSPHSVGQPRQDELISLDFLSPDLAVAKVRLRILDEVFEDHLSIARIDGAFRVVAKTRRDA